MSSGKLPREDAEQAMALLRKALTRDRRTRLWGFIVVMIALVAVGYFAVAAYVRPEPKSQVQRERPPEPSHRGIAELDGRHVAFQRSVPGVHAAGKAVVMSASKKGNVRIAIALKVPEGRATVFLRRPDRRPLYMYDILGPDTQTTTWAKATLRRYRSIVVVARNPEGTGTVLHLPVHKLLGIKTRPGVRSTRSITFNPVAARRLRRFVARRSAGVRHECVRKRRDRPRRSNAQIGCRVAGAKGVYVSFRTRSAIGRYIAWFRSTTKTFSTQIDSCPTDGGGWYRTARGEQEEGKTYLRRRPGGRRVLMIVYPARRIVARFESQRARRVCAPWWRAS